MFDPTWLLPDWNCELCGSLSHETMECPLYVYVEKEKEETPVLEHESLAIETKGQ